MMTTTVNPMAGEANGVHTPAAQQRVLAYLSALVPDMEFRAHGSCSRGLTSGNDMDIIAVSRLSEDEMREAAYRAEDEVRDRVTRGELTEHEAMELLFGEGPAPLDSIEGALAAIGFVPTGGAEWLGIRTIRCENASTGHAIEIWEQGDPNHYGL